MRVSGGLAGIVATVLVIGSAAALGVPSVRAATADTSQTLYVDSASGCSDTGSGTEAAPFCTLQAAAYVGYYTAPTRNAGVFLPAKPSRLLEVTLAGGHTIKLAIAGKDGAIDLYNYGTRPVTVAVDLTGSYYAY